MARLGFALWTLLARFNPQHNHCPYCRSILHLRLQRKKFLIEARKCQYCSLIFRWPADTPAKARQFYEREYCSTSSGIAVDLPSMEELPQLLASGFNKSHYDKSGYIELVKTILAPPARVLDFGASWGYMGFQLKNVGYTVEGFEFSMSRAEFGQLHLGFPVHSSWEQLKESLCLPRFDMIFTAHTLEHVYDLWGTLDKLAEVVVPGGILVIIVPNGGGREARELGIHWGPFIGETHTMSLTADWFQQNLPRHGFELMELFSTGPSGRDLRCDGEELVCVARHRELLRPNFCSSLLA